MTQTTYLKVTNQVLPIENIDISREKHPGAFVRPRFSLGHKRFMESDNATNHIEDAPLMSRAWGFQERLLPARTLHFHAEELIWECKTGVNCECTWLDNVQLVVAEKALKSGWLKASMFSESAKPLESYSYVRVSCLSAKIEGRRPTQALGRPSIVIETYISYYLIIIS
jgi:hypothetical protein